MKRIILFLATNLAIVLVLSITMRLLGVEPYLTEAGLNLGSLLIFAAVMGMGGSFISLAISKWTAKRMTGARVIETPETPGEVWLVETVRQSGADRRHRHAGSGDFRLARRQRLRHRHEQEQCAGGGVHRPAAGHDQARKRKRCWGTKSPTSPTATW